MNKRTKLYAVLACIAVVGIGALLYVTLTRGAPAVQVSAYAGETLAPAAATEPKFLPGSAVPGMKLAAETDALAMYIHEETTELAVVDKKSGKVWRTNPETRSEDAKASPVEKERLSSQVTVNYRDRIGTLGAFTNYAHSILNKQFKIESIEGGLRLTYTIGDMSLGIDALPKYIGKQRMEEKVLSQLDDQTKVTINRAYLPSETNPDVMERLDTAVERPLVLQRVLDAFAKAGYTEEDLAFDNEENGIGAGGEEKPNFTVVLEYRLDGDSLVVNMPADRIAESQGFKIRNLELLNFFGAAGSDEQGYMLVPDGSGGLIHLNNGKSNAEVYAQRVYGDDYNDNSGRRGQVAESVRLPVFGLKSGDGAWFAQIEKGDAIAAITADIGGRQNSFNHIHASFALRGEDELELYKGNEVDEIQLLSESRYTGDIQVRYSFLDGSDATYAGMAKIYRERLAAEGKLTALDGEGALPFFVDVLGAVDKRKSFLGVPYKGIVPMTTFRQAGEIADTLAAKGITDVHMRYLGWFNGGMKHAVPSEVDLEGKLGSKSEFRLLAEKLAAAGGKLYPDAAFQHVLRDSFAFKPASDAARFITREQAMRTPYNRAFNTMDYDLGLYWLLSPAKLPYFVDRFMADYGDYGIDAIALRDLGDLLHADYRASRVVFRDTAKNIVTEQLGKLEQRFPNLLLTGGNAYALPYADKLINAPMEGSSFNIVDETVPFYQMVIHGYMDYSGSPINLSDEQDLQTQLLRSVEYGAAPHFLWTHESSSELKFTAYDSLFSTAYAGWIEEAAKMYAKSNEALGGLRSQPIVNRIVHQEGVVEVRYGNGDAVYVNYTDQPVTVNGTTVEATNFTVGSESN
ncbi:DUF5696 domain-containing protein [Paenibacillus methanolicus]|uniref:Uncharacterized protein n=1 Tax=Paenibacillus methanolicus TaxID=582686 RepID=A0A5S5CB87_9BACL|nr:DUF5696 domain-containing protein [Paenibacillus methanolicus]TYP76645.1 hypothetical protein BCM02_103307 [Paenibacillus methanolicus]